MSARSRIYPLWFDLELPTIMHIVRAKLLLMVIAPVFAPEVLLLARERVVPFLLHLGLSIDPLIVSGKSGVNGLLR